MADQPIRVLLVEDNPGDARLIRELLAEVPEATFEVMHTERVSDALDWLAKAHVDVILADLALPDATGLQTVNRLRDQAPEVPLVVLTGTTVDDRVALQALQEGAQDYLVKGQVDSRQLGRALRYAIERKQLQRNLEEANARLKALSALKDEFVANISHELRTPLATIREGISLVLDEVAGPASDEQRQFLAIARKDAERLSALIDNLLDLSKIEAGKVTLARRRVDLLELVRQTCQSCRRIAGTRRLVCEERSVPPVFADPDRILQVLTNLVSNAVKFTAEEGTVTCRLEARDGAVAVSVQDDGVGIAPDDVPHLFKKFSQVGTSDGRPKGTGLGLALCKELVECHSGTIAVTSAPGKGSTFTLTLPLYTATGALEEHFAELARAARQGDVDTVGLIALDGRPCCEHRPTVQQGHPPRDLGHLAELIRQHVHRKDVVLTVEPHWVVILTLTDGAGIQAAVRRLRSVVGLDGDVPFGAALYPADGQDVHALLAKATGTLDRGLAAIEGLPDGASLVREPPDG